MYPFSIPVPAQKTGTPVAFWSFAVSLAMEAAVALARETMRWISQPKVNVSVIVQRHNGTFLLLLHLMMKAP